MQIATLAFVLTLPSIAAAGPLGGAHLSVSPSRETGSLGGWLAGEIGPVYLGGEAAIETLDLIEGDIGLSYHLLVGHRRGLTELTQLLVDAGIGVTQEERLGLLTDHGNKTLGTVPSGALRVQLGIESGRTANLVGMLALVGELRGAYADGASAGGMSLGVGFVISGASEGR